MKSVTLNEHAERDAEKTGRKLNGKRSLTTGVGVTDRLERLLLAAQEMGGPAQRRHWTYGISFGARAGQGDGAQSQRHHAAGGATSPADR